MFAGPRAGPFRQILGADLRTEPWRRGTCEQPGTRMNIDANAGKVCEGDEVFLHLSKEAPRKRLLARIDDAR
jgi:hypothetical protein